MFIFRSLIRNTDFDKPRVSFREHSFSTNDAAVAEAIRKMPNFNRDIFDVSVIPEVRLNPVTLEHIEPTPKEVEIPVEPAVEPTVEHKRRGRPPRVVHVVQGIRTSEVTETKEKQE